MKTVALTLAVFLSQATPGLTLKFVEDSKTALENATHVSQVVELLTELKVNIEADGVAEQTSYDKYACWCEDALAKKAQDITTAKDTIEELRTRIVKLSGELGAHGADISQLGKDIAANVASQKEATQIRDKEAAGYEGEKIESEQCIGALEAAIGVLHGAGTKKGFLETIQQAQLLSVVAGVRGLLRRPAVEKSVGEKELQVVRDFVEHPSDFVRRGTSAAQVSKGPFPGDYSPQSTQIGGILKSMYDSFTMDLERANGEEATKQKGFVELMETKQQELTTLRASLQSHTGDKATKGKSVADGKVELDDTQVQLDADEAFFAQAKQSCSGKAGEWAQRTRLRTEEVAGITQAVAILSSDEAKATFENASTTFVQLAAEVVHSGKGRIAAYNQLKRLVGQSQDLRIAELAVRVKTGGHFDAIMTTIDNMIVRLREEEGQDIEERDWCESKQNKNKNDLEDIGNDITKTGQTVTRLGNEVTALDTKIGALATDINTTQESIDELLSMRVGEQEAFAQGVKDDARAIELLDVAIRHLNSYYAKKGMASLAQQRRDENSTDSPPDVTWSGTYNKREGEGRGVVAILELIKDKFGSEIKSSRSADAAAQASYESDRTAALATLRAQTKSKTELEKTKADTGVTIADKEEFSKQRGEDQTAETDKKTALDTNCGWVETHFASRRDNRQKEIDGLTDAKNYLAGVDSE